MTGALEARLDWGAVDCVVLDMDGTLLDLRFDHLVWNERLPQVRSEALAGSLESVREQTRVELEQTRGTLIYYCMEHWSRTFGLDLFAIEAELECRIRTRPGARDFLARVSALDRQLILATNAHPRSLERKMQRTELAGFFDYIVSSHELGYAKEDPEFWIALSDRADFNPQRTVLIDDNHAVLDTAAAFGVKYLFAVARPDSAGDPVSSETYRCLDSFEELLS